MELRKNMVAHNKKYHNEGPYSVNVFQVIAGPNMGKMIWSRGPCDFEHIGKNPGGEAHNEDWVTNIIPLTEDISHNGYWRLNGNFRQPLPYIRI